VALIDLRGISKVYDLGGERIHALRKVDLKIEEGEFVSIIGPSGSGKSTLMNILGLLDHPNEGAYLLDGKPVQALSDDQRSLLRNQKIGFVFQNFNLLPRASALRNVEMPLIYSASYDHAFSNDKIRKQALEALRQVRLTDRKEHKPNELSGGQRQRVAIARALVNKPRILFADEPTGNLDSKTGVEILGLFEDLHKQGVSIIIVTHDPKIANFANRVLEVLDGEILHDRKGGRRADS